MKKRQFFISIFVGLLAGQIFAEGDRPFTVINTVRFGYDDNVYKEADNQEESVYIEDIVDLAFRAALSSQTDLIFKSKFKYRADKESNLYPNFYAILTHSASPRLLLQLSDYYKSGGTTSSSTSGRYDYFENTVSFAPTYVLSPKDRLSAPISYKIKRLEDKVDDENYDQTVVGLTWKRDLIPQRTWMALNARRIMVDYINRHSTYDANELTAELSHTFNQNWTGHVEAGLTFSDPSFSYLALDGTNVVTVKADKSVNPLFVTGLAYEPSPRTRLTVDVSRRYQESNDSRHSGETASELRFGAQHDFTAKIMGKATARFLESEYDSDDSESSAFGKMTEDRFDLNFLLRYKLNRINSIELGMKHSEKTYEDGDRDWDQNMIDIGWRVEL